MKVCLKMTKPSSPPASPSTGVYRRNQRSAAKTEFARHYDRGDMPLYVTPDGVSRRLQWKMTFDEMDYGHYLPLFFHGVREKQEPHKYIARQGLKDMFNARIDKVVDVIPNLVIAIKAALMTKDNEIMSEMLKTIQHILVHGGESAGVAFVPYYRQILPIFRMFYRKNVNIGDGIYYSQFKRENLGDLIDETLSLFEKYGGKNAFINIKYMIPTYESQWGRK